MAGNYYIDIGVVSFDKGKRTLLAFVSDAMIFKVQPLDNGYVQAGITYLDQKAEIKKVN